MNITDQNIIHNYLSGYRLIDSLFLFSFLLFSNAFHFLHCTTFLLSLHFFFFFSFFLFSLLSIPFLSISFILTFSSLLSFPLSYIHFCPVSISIPSLFALSFFLYFSISLFLSAFPSLLPSI